MATFYFYRFSLSTGTNNLAKAEYVFNIITRGAVYVYRNDSYQFMNVQYLKVDSSFLIVGEILKYKPFHEDQRINDENQVEPYVVKNKVIARVRFFIDTESSVIAADEDRSHIPKQSFAERFSELFKKNSPESLARIAVSAITENYSFEQRLAEVAEIRKIDIRLVPSNPHNNDIWKRIDERLKQRNVTNYHETQENKRKGESLIVDEETKTKFAMSEDGYGASTVRGKDSNGRRVTVSTTDGEMQSKTPVDKEIPTEEQARKLNQKISDIAQRTPNSASPENSELETE